MKRFKGIIALDIDGTITVSRHSLEDAVRNYLNRLISEQWQLIFITGRTFSFARPILNGLEGEYYLAVQNGAALFSMPHEKPILKSYLPTDLIPKLEHFFHQKGTGLLVESGKENQDLCFYRPADFSSLELEYIDFRIEISPEKWVPVETFDQLSIKEFAVGKYFAPEKEALELAENILKAFPLSVIVIRDPFRPGFHLAHVNAQETSKGKVLENFRALHQQDLPVIAAGDDYNDVEMLEKSTIKIVMQNGPAKLHQIADILAPPVQQQGIIKGLEEAIWKVSSK